MRTSSHLGNRGQRSFRAKGTAGRFNRDRFVQGLQRQRIEAGLDKDIRRELRQQGYQTDVHDLRRLFPGDVRAQELHVLPAKEQPQESEQVADGTSAGILPVIRPTYDVVHAPMRVTRRPPKASNSFGTSHSQCCKRKTGRQQRS